MVLWATAERKGIPNIKRLFYKVYVVFRIIERFFVPPPPRTNPNPIFIGEAFGFVVYWE